MFPDEREEVRIEELGGKLELLEESITRIEQGSDKLLAENIQLKQIIKELLDMEELDIGDRSLLPPDHPIARAEAL